MRAQILRHQAQQRSVESGIQRDLYLYIKRRHTNFDKGAKQPTGGQMKERTKKEEGAGIDQAARVSMAKYEDSVSLPRNEWVNSDERFK